MSEYIYIIVHPNSIKKSREPNEWKELQRTKSKEKYFIVRGDPSEIPENLPRKKLIRLCGGLIGVCLADQLNSLRKQEYKAFLYYPACV